MTSQYTGFRVELTSSEIGKIVGVVSSVTDKKISLTNAIINDFPPTIPSFAVESQFIQNIRILSTASGDESSGSETPIINTKKSSNSSREQRREWLRNIPNTYNVYVCPDSPPIIHRTPGAPGFDKHGSGQLNDLQLLDSGLAKVSISESNDCSPARKFGGTKVRGPSKRRSYSMSETAATTSDVSGAESDSYNRYPNSCTRGHFSGGGGGGGGGGNRQAHNRGHSRNNQNYNHRGGGNIGLNGNSSSCGSGSNNHQKSSVDWDRICVEEFIDEDFDFEGNLALFNKSAFYEMVDQREGNTSFGYTTDMNSSSCISSTPPCFTEGPDGVGIPLFAISTPSSHSTITTTTSSKTVSSRSTSTTTSSASSTTTTTQMLPATSMDSHHKDRNKLANSTPLSSTPYRNNKSQSQSVVYNPMNTIHSGDNDESNIVIHAQSRSNPTRRNSSSWWYTCTGQRVPVCHLEQRQRLVHYLATGHLDNQTRDALISSSLNTINTFQGLTWGRLIESASRPLVDNIMMYLRQSSRTPQRVVHRPPARILIIPNGSNHLGAVLSLSVARQLSSLGACVLLYASTLSTKNSSSTDKNDVDIVNDEYPVNNTTSNNKNNKSMSSIYRHELNLLTHLAPKPNQYGLDDDEDESYEDNETDNDEDNHDNANDKQQQQQQQLLCGYNSKNSNLIQYYSIGDINGNIEQNDTDFDNISSCFGHSDSVHASQYNIVDYSSVGRMWMSRMPGLKIIRRSSSITKLPSSIRIDLVIIGHSDDDNDNTENELNSSFKSNTNPLINWLRNHNSIGGIIHLTPCQSMINSNDLLRNAQQFVWIVELGLPVLTAVSSLSTSTAGSPTSDANEITASNTSSAAAATSAALSTGVSLPLTHLLIDIGLGRNIVRRLTGDLNLLPPYGLFDMGPMIPLRSADQHTIPSTVSMTR
ncbi:unnamed protein product [Trichobilharzia szidati]|nr:unnamed protein product [Trichobilharzia szidati]